MDFAALPKVELHLHLDCSLSYGVVKKLNPAISPEEYRRDFVAPPKCTDLADYITRALAAIELMQTAEALRLVTADLFEQLQADNVIYAEMRFAPLEHTRHGLSPEAVVETVQKAVAQGSRQTGIPAGLILCTLRHYSEAQSMGTIRLVEQFRGTAVTGFDIAADEAGFPIDNHKAAFEYAFQKNIPCTAHAGEARGAGSVWETLRHFHPRRIGHGVRSAEDPELLNFLKQRDIHLEVCPTSNIQTNVYAQISDHAVDKIYQSGVSLGINTDARTISDTTLGTEYKIMEQVFGWGKAELLRCNLNAVEAAFTGEEVKESLRKRLLEAYR